MIPQEGFSTVFEGLDTVGQDRRVAKMKQMFLTVAGREQTTISRHNRDRLMITTAVCHSPFDPTPSHQPQNHCKARLILAPQNAKLFQIHSIMPSLPLMLGLGGVTLDPAYCRRKCESLFWDSPHKLGLCLGTCAVDWDAADPFVSAMVNRKQVDCLTQCSANSTAGYHGWVRCRKSCGGPTIAFECSSECDRLWKRTVHWHSCLAECRRFGRAAINRTLAANFSVW
jgi:hypothetical protein